MLDQFYAVTLTSIYKVAAIENYRASAIKIALKGTSGIPQGKDIAEGGMIAICRNLQAYIPEKYGMTNQLCGFERCIEMVNTRYWGIGSSPIVALFKTEDEALACFNDKGQESCDSRWLESTKQVLKEIGEEHPSFYISHFKRMELVPVTSN